MFLSIVQLDWFSMVGKFEVWAFFCDPVNPEYIVIITRDGEKVFAFEKPAVERGILQKQDIEFPAGTILPVFVRHRANGNFVDFPVGGAILHQERLFDIQAA